MEVTQLQDKLIDMLIDVGLDEISTCGTVLPLKTAESQQMMIDFINNNKDTVDEKMISEEVCRIYELLFYNK
jgi:hypothetical protein